MLVPWSNALLKSGLCYLSLTVVSFKRVSPVTRLLRMKASLDQRFSIHHFSIPTYQVPMILSQLIKACNRRLYGSKTRSPPEVAVPSSWTAAYCSCHSPPCCAIWVCRPNVIVGIIPNRHAVVATDDRGGRSNPGHFVARDQSRRCDCQPCRVVAVRPANPI